MTLDEALIIAKRIEDDDVVGPVGMAIRVLLKEYEQAVTDYLELHGLFFELQGDFDSLEARYRSIT